MNDISCEDVVMFTDDYFKGSLSPLVIDKILAHLVVCKSCRELYSKTSRDKGVTFRLKQEIEKIAKLIYRNLPSEECYSITMYNEHRKQVGMTSNTALIPLPEKSWTNAAKAEDYSTIMNCQSIREFVLEDYNVNAGEEIVFRKFGVYMTIKLAENIDFLEKCLRLKTEEGRDV